MAEMATSAIVGEVVGQIFSGIMNKHKDGSDADSSSIERLEMACIKIDATIEASNQWQITDLPLLRWRKKLKRVSVECDDELRRCKQRSLEDKEIKDKLRQSSFPRRVAYSTKSLLSSLVNHQSKAVVRRFERLANGADDFLRLVQLSGAPLPYIFHGPLDRHIFAGRYTEYHRLQRQGSMLKCFSIRPMSFEERGLEAMLAFIHEDRKAPKDNFRLGLMLRLSQSTDVIGITVKCLQLLTPHFNSISELVIRELTQLPLQDFKWSPTHNEPGDMEHWNQIHDTLTQSFRPDPFCCKQNELQNMSAACSSSSSSTNAPGLSGIFPEQVIGVFLQRHILLSEYQELQGSKMTCHRTSSFQEDVLLLKLRILFMPHHPLEDIKFDTEAKSSAIEAIEQLLDANVHPHQIDSLVLPKAVEFLHHNAEATMYRVSWKSKHGSAHLYVQKTSKEMTGTGARTRQVWRNNSNAFMAYEVETGMTTVIHLGMAALSVVSFLLTHALVRTAMNARQCDLDE